MTSEEIRETIEQLRKMPHECGTYTVRTPELCDRLIELLEQADPDTHVELPKDADGEYVHIGDMMECDRLPNGCRVCGEVKAIGDGIVWLHNVQYAIHAEYLHHHHTLTVLEILDELEGLRGHGDYEVVVTRAAELAGQLRELMQDD